MKNEFKNINKQLQFYNTPLDTVNKLLSLIDFDLNNKDILEPSAGQGGILSLLKDKYPNNNFYFCEFLDYNRDELLKNIRDINFICNDFLKIKEYTNKKFDLIIANPPFSKNQDIEHITKMIEITKEEGYIISICSNKWRKTQKQKKVKNFINLLNNNTVELIELNNGEFKNIGLNIETCILKIKKENNLFLNNNYDFSIKEPEFEPEPLYIEDFEDAIIKYYFYKNNIKDEKINLREVILAFIRENRT